MINACFTYYYFSHSNMAHVMYCITPTAGIKPKPARSIWTRGRTSPGTGTCLTMISVNDVVISGVLSYCSAIIYANQSIHQLSRTWRTSWSCSTRRCPAFHPATVSSCFLTLLTSWIQVTGHGSLAGCQDTSLLTWKSWSQLSQSPSTNASPDCR